MGENTENYITFLVQLKKENDKSTKITYKLKFIDSYRFMSTSLSNLVDNLSGVYDKECKKCMERKKIRLNCQFIGFENGRLNYKCKECKKSYTKVTNESIKNFPTLYKLCNGDLNKFFLLLRKGIYPFEYMDSWERFDENIIPPKEAFYSQLNLENITDKDYEHVKKIWEAFEIKNLGEYHDLYVQCDTFLLADVFKTFRNKCIGIYKLNPAHFLSARGLARQACFKKAKVKSELLTDIDILLMVEKGTRGGICQAIHRYVKANNKYMKNYDRGIISSFLTHLDANNLYGWAMSQKLLVNGFKWVEKSRLSRFNEIFVKNYNENSDTGYFLDVDVDYPKELFNLHKDLPFLPKRKKVNKVEKFVCNVEDREKYVMHIKVLKQALNHGLVFKKVHRVIQFNQKEWLKPYIDTNTKLRKEANKRFFQTNE